MPRLALLLAALLFCAHAQAVQVADDGGHVITVDKPAQRIVSLAPHLTELLFAAGAGAQVVGVGEYSDYPAAAKSIPRVGDSAMLDLERIVALKPDLLVVWRDGNAPQQLQRLATLGIPIYSSQLGQLADIATTVRRLGQLAGTAPAAEARARGFEQALQDLRARYAGRRELRVFYQIWHRPLLTINSRHLISESLRLCGARNVFADLIPLTPTVSEEAVLALDPDAIVTGSIDPKGPDNLDVWRQLKTLRATRQNALLTVNPDTLHRSSDRIVDGVRELCEKLESVRVRTGP